MRATRRVASRAAFVAAVLVAGLISASVRDGALASASGASASPCSAALATLSVSTDHARYQPGTPVRVTVALRNHSSSACTYATGPTSPNLRLVNAAGVTVWGSCWAGGAPSPCADFLVQRTLAAGATSLERFSWDQRSGTPDQQVPAGRYRLSVSLQGLFASTSLVVAQARTIALSVADDGRRFSVNVGDRVSVSLPTAGVLHWGRVQTSNPAVLAVLAAATPAGVTVLEARHAGVATITATGNPSCYPECLMPSRLLRITVVVRAN